ncbi:MAG: histidine kinase [Lachnospiraceae bacterium]|jgi:two-component system sensor histidine kinase YesM|nr:histidine kinase [Lachnospiraceae bacterium]
MDLTEQQGGNGTKEKHADGRITAKFRSWLSRTPLWLILTIFLTFILFLLTFTTWMLSYRRNYAQNIRSAVSNSQQKLSLKMENLENYIDDLSSFAIQPCYDDTFYHALRLTQPFSEALNETILTDVGSYYYARRDIRSYEIMLLNQNISVSRGIGEQHFHIRTIDADEVRDTEYYRLCEESPRNLAIMPPEEAGTLLTFYHTLLSLPRQTSAVVRIRVDDSMLPEISKTAAGSGEFFCLCNSEGQLLYSGGSDVIASGSELSPLLPENAAAAQTSGTGGAAAGSPRYITLHGVRYLATSAVNARYGLTLISLLPVSELMAELNRSQVIIIVESLLIWAVGMVLVFMIIRYFTASLTVIARKQKDVGAGDLSQIRVAGCRETTELNESFNEMTRHINELIEQNYVSSLNEKTARLAALEAQINPHYLYNTLQAIGSEALMNDQPGIYTMLTDLASNLRYSIKADNLVTLKDEMQYVDSYIALMKIRLQDKLTVEQSVAPETLGAIIPKISIQSIVENSLAHGFSGDVTSIRIRIETNFTGDYLVVNITDNGRGISAEDLAKLRGSFRRQTLQDPGRGIGLANLYSRIQLLYDGDADILIKSRTGEDSFTSVTMIVSKERALSGAKEKN